MSVQRLLLEASDGGLHVISPYGLYFIGRDHACDMAFPADPTLSSRHAVIHWTGEHYVIRDFKSRNGIRVDGDRTSVSILKSGTVLEVGSQSMRVRPLSEETNTDPKLLHTHGHDPIIESLMNLNRIASALFMETDPTRLPDKIVAISTSLTKSSHGFFAYPAANDESGFSIIASLGFDVPADTIVDWCLPALGQSVAARSIIVDSISSMANVSTAMAFPLGTQAPFDHYALAPIRHYKQDFGILFIGRNPEAGAFGRDETTQLLPFVRYAGLAFYVASSP